MNEGRFDIRIKEKIKKVESLLSFRCNNNCSFCSWGHKMQAFGGENYSDKTYLEAKEDIDFAKSIGASLFSFSGGEPTIRKDLIDLIYCAKKKGFENIQIQTNGRMLSYREFAKKILKAGVNDIAFTVLSIDPKIHDALAQAQNSHKQVIQGIKNVININPNIRLRLNVVINKKNFKELPELTDFLMKFMPFEINYDFVIIDGHVLKYPKKMVPKYSDIVPYLHKALSISSPKIWTPIFNIPYCIAGKYKDRVVDSIQPATILIGKDFSFSIKDNRRNNKVKFAKCQKCKYDKRCFGVQKRYVEIYGDKEFIPID